MRQRTVKPSQSVAVSFHPSPTSPGERRLASILRSRAWHERRTAAGKCHRCPDGNAGRFWYCRKCRIELSRIRAVARAARKGAVVPFNPLPDASRRNVGASV